MNITILKGRLTKDPEMRETKGGMKIANFCVATDKFSNGEKSADFHNCVAFDKWAEFAVNFFHQGDPILVNGKNTSGKYPGKDGKDIYTYQVTVNSLEFCSGKNSDTQAQQTKRATNTKKKEDFMNVPDDDEDGLPFA